MKLSKTNIEIPFIAYRKDKNVKLKQVRITPKISRYIIEVVYEREEIDLGLDKSKCLGIDLGLNNLMTLTSNKEGFKPLTINGKPLKSINQYYNKQLSKYKCGLPLVITRS